MHRFFIQSIIDDHNCRTLVLYYRQEVVIMMKSYSVVEYAQVTYNKDVDTVLNFYQRKFESKFNKDIKENITLDITFDNALDMTQFYQELKYHRAFIGLYTVTTHPTQDLTLLVSGKKTLFDYLGSKEPNLLTISRTLGIDFKVRFRQKYSGTDFKGHIIGGELLSRQCIVEVNNTLPELSLGLLKQIGESTKELDLLLTRIIPVPTINIL